MQLLLISLIITAALMAVWILLAAAAEVSIIQRIVLCAIPMAVSLLITWLAWNDAAGGNAPTPGKEE